MSYADFWYVRFPDGRTLRAASTTILRQELSARRIPFGSMVRRSPSDEWVALEWTQEFADMMEDLAISPSSGKTPVPRAYSPSGAPSDSSSRRSGNSEANPPATVGSRLDPSRLHLIGVRGYVDELLAALDSTLVPKKLLLGLIAGLLLGTLFVFARSTSLGLVNTSRPIIWLLPALGLLVFEGICSLLTRLTYLELARLRPPHWRAAFQGLGRLTLGAFVSKLLVWGALGGLIFVVRWLPFWLSPGEGESWTQSQRFVAGIDMSMGMLFEVLLYPILFFSWLIPPLLASEECSATSGLWQWMVLVRRNVGSVILYQVLAVSLGVLMTTPFQLLVAPFYLPWFRSPEELHEVAGGMRFFLLGLACAPLLTYWITANVFIYLNLRYGASSRL
jgi:hypothetical protein